MEMKIPLSWGSLAAITRGPENGRRFLLLHGWLDNAASFDPLSEHFPGDWRTVALDLPGHGHSDHRPVGMHYHLSDSALDIVRVADALGWDRFSIIGHSLGGGAATVIAGAFPQRIEKVVLIEALGFLSSKPQDTPLRLAQLYTEENALAGKRLPIYPDVQTAVRARLQAGGLMPEAARTLTERSLKKTEGGFTWGSDRRLRLPTQRHTEEQIRAFIANMKCPTLGVFAEEGMVFQQPGWKDRADLIPSFSWKKVAGGHHVHMEDPKPVADIITNWIG